MSDNPANDSRNKIVIGVDDNEANLAFLKSAVTSAGYTFFGATSGAECLSLVLRVPPRLILLDIQMPWMDGFETCRRLRALAETATVPIAFLTACKTREDVRTGLAAGGNDFIVKPFLPAHLLERVRHWTTRSVRAAATPA